MTSSKKLRKWNWVDPIYDVAVVLLHGSGEAAQQFIEKTFNDGEPLAGKCEWMGAKTLFTTGDQGVALTIWVPHWWSAKSSLHLGVLAHESMHGALYVLRNRGIDLTESSEEAFTYYVTWLFRNCHERLVKS